jgi:2',3'-cyclic-nucleotide 2'-phosphodiesterase
MRILFIGDIVGTPGVSFVKRAVPALVAREGIDLVVANAENAADGTGLTPSQYRQLREKGVNVVTMGDHVYKKSSIIQVMENDDGICRPANFPAEAPGREYVIALTASGVRVGVFCLLGRTFMRPTDCPFHAADRVLEKLAGQASCVIVDMHAEATGDKYLMANHLDGRVGAVFGTHTHVPTADEQIMPRGTAFICDVGMTGPYHSILGRRIDRVLPAAMTFVPSSFDVADEDVRLGGAIVDLDPATGLAQCIRRIMVDEKALAELSA